MLKKTRDTVSILIFLTFCTIFFRQSIHSDNTIYQNYDATYHALLTITALKETPISQHHLLPIVSLGNDADKSIPWGGTTPDANGNYYYTSFPLGGFVIPYGIFNGLNIDASVNNLFIFSSFILITSVLLIFFLAKKIYRYYSGNESNAPAFLVGVIYIFSIETLYSHGFVYWGHSLFQPIYLYFLYLVFTALTERSLKSTLYYPLFFIAFLLGSIEWSGGLVILGSVIVFILSDHPAKRKYVLALILGGASALLVFGLVFLNTVEAESFFNALKIRFLARSITNPIPIILLANKYWESYGGFLIILILFPFMSFYLKDKKYKKHVLSYMALIIMFGLLENIIMKQHAITYHFDRLKLLPIFAIVIPVIWSLNKRFYSFFVVTIILLTSINSLYNYPKLRITESTALTENENFINGNFLQECHSCTLGVNTFVRGYINLLFHQGVYEHMKSVHHIPMRNNLCACYVNATGVGGGGGVIKINGFEKHVFENSSFNLTDTNWVKGISNFQPAFFVLNTPQNRMLYSVGKNVKFVDESERAIKFRTESDTYLNIFLDGVLLDGNKVGYPHKIEVIQ